MDGELYRRWKSQARGMVDGQQEEGWDVVLEGGGMGCRTGRRTSIEAYSALDRVDDCHVGCVNELCIGRQSVNQSVNC